MYRFFCVAFRFVSLHHYNFHDKVNQFFNTSFRYSAMRNSIWIYIFFFLAVSIASAQNKQESPEHLLAFAQAYFNEGKLSIALDHLDDAIAQRKEFVEAYLLRSRVHEKMDNISSALTDLTIVLHLDPLLSEARFKRAVLFYQSHRYGDAIQDFHRLLKDPAGETTSVYFKGKTDPSGYSASGITSLQSDMLADVLNYLSLSHLSDDRLDSAEHYILRALERKSDEADFYVNQGLIAEKKCDTTSAIQAYQKALSLEYDHAAALNNLQTISKGSDYQHLIHEAYDVAVSEQGSYQAYFNRAMLRQASGNHRSALRDFDQAIRLAGENDEILIMRAYSREYSADLQGAIEDYSRAIKINPLLIKAYLNRGNTYYKLKKYAQAIDDYKVAISLDPENPKLFYNRGLALYLTGKKSDGCMDLHKALEMGYSAAQRPILSYCQ
jgi:tetratricopeptide (TPR) repeat protein